MQGYVTNLEQVAKANHYFRQVLYTAPHCQLVVMSLNPGEDIGEEVHQLDQFIRVEQGSGQSILNGVTHELSDGFAVVIPAGVRHNIINTGSTEMKLYTVYAPPNHKDKTIHETKAVAEASEENYDGVTTEA